MLSAGQRGSADTLRLPHQAGCSSGGRGPAMVTRLEALGREWGLSLQTPHLWPPGPKQPSGPTAPSGQRHSVHGCAQKRTSTWVTHSQGPRQTAVPHSCKMSPPPLTPTHPAVISQVYYSHTQCPRSHTHTCMHDKDMQLQSVTETEKSQVHSHIQLQGGFAGDLKVTFPQ